jgi:hypothetical protein
LPQDPKAAELAKVRDAIDRACRVANALGCSPSDGVTGKEYGQTIAELCTLRARERALAAEVEKGTP